MRSRLDPPAVLQEKGRFITCTPFCILMARREDQARRKVFRATKRPQGCKQRAMPDRGSIPWQEGDPQCPNRRSVRSCNRSARCCLAHHGVSRHNFCGKVILLRGQKQECLLWCVLVCRNGNVRASSRSRAGSRAVEFFHYTF